MSVVVSRGLVVCQLTRGQTGHYWRHNRLLARMASSATTWISGPFNWVQGQRTAPADASPGSFDNVSPRTGRLLAKVPTSGQLEINRAVAAARAAFPAWSALSGQSCRCWSARGHCRSTDGLLQGWREGGCSPELQGS